MATFIKDIEEIRERARKKIEDGAVTEAYGLDQNRAIAILNEALATEIVCVLRYLHHYFMATGVHGRAVADEFKEHADDEREHADEIAERIQQLGGKPDFNPASLLSRSVAQYVEGETLADMIREDLIAERTVIEVYQQMIQFFGEQDPTTRRLLEHIKAEEEEHASDLSDFLYIVDPSSGETRGEDPGANPLEHGERRAQSSNAGQPQGQAEEMLAYSDLPLDSTGEELRGRDARGQHQDNVSRQMVDDSERALEELRSRSGNTGQTDRAELRRAGNTDRRGDDIAPEAPIQEVLAGMNKSTGKEAPNRGKTRSLGVSPTPQSRGGETQPTGGKRQNREEVDKNERWGNLGHSQVSGESRDTRRETQAQTGMKGEMRPARDRGTSKREEREPFAGRGTVEAPASNLPGVGGRTMNRRRPVDEIDETDIAEQGNDSGSRGTNRSAKILNKTRKKRAA